MLILVIFLFSMCAVVQYLQYRYLKTMSNKITALEKNAVDESHLLSLNISSIMTTIKKTQTELCSSNDEYNKRLLDLNKLIELQLKENYEGLNKRISEVDDKHSNAENIALEAMQKLDRFLENYKIR